MVKSFSMLIKGSLLALLIAGAYAADTGNSRKFVVHTEKDTGKKYVIRYSSGVEVKVYTDTNGWNAGGSRQRNGGSVRARTGRARKKTGNRRSNQPTNNNWAKPSESSESWETTPESNSWDKPVSVEPEWVSPSWDEPTGETTTQWSDDGHQVCDVANRNMCCDLGSDMLEVKKRSVCKLLGCDYDKCQWRDDGYSGGGGGGGYNSGKDYKIVVVKENEDSTDEYEEDDHEVSDSNVEARLFFNSKVEDYPEPSSAPSEPSYDGDVCDEHAKIFCCSQTEGTFHEKKSICDQMSCAWQKCGWGKRSGWDDDGHKPTPTPTSWKDDGHDQCDLFARNICCTQDDKLPVGEKKLVCDKLNCMYKKCGWKRDGYDDDDYKPAWKDDGYSKDDDNKYKSDYDDDWKKDGYDDDDNKLAWKNDGYNKDYDVYQKNKYGFQNDYGDDKCTADKLEECCTANEKKQVMVCATYRCNIEKCYKKDGGWDDTNDARYDMNNGDDECTSDEKEKCCTSNDWGVCQMLGCKINKCDKYNAGGYDETGPEYKVLYKPEDKAPRYEVFPENSDGNNKPTLRPTYRPYANRDSNMNPYNNNGYNPTLPTLRPTYRKYPDGNNNAYPDPNVYPNVYPNHDPYANVYPNVYPNPDPYANVYPNPVPNDVYPRQYGDGGYGN